MRIGSAIRSGSSRGRVQPVEYATGPPPAGKPRQHPATRQRPRSAGATRRSSSGGRGASGGGGGDPLRSGGGPPRPASAASARNGAATRPSQPRPASAKASRAPVSAWLNGRHPGTLDVPGSAGSNRNRPGFGRPGSASSASKGRDPAPAQSSERREYRPGAASSQRPGHKPAGSSGYGQSYDRPASAHGAPRATYGQDKPHHVYGSGGAPPRPYSAASGRDAAAAKAAAYQREQRDRDQQSGALRPQSASAARPQSASSNAHGQRLLVGGTSSGAYPSSGGYSTRPQSAQPTVGHRPAMSGADGGRAETTGSTANGLDEPKVSMGGATAPGLQGGTNRPQSAGGGVRQSTSGRDAYHCAPEQREYLTRLLVGSVQNRRGLPDFYSFGKVIGVGSFGTVRIAWHKLTGQKVAIKTYERSKMKDPQQWKRVQQEARVMEKLSDSPLVCRFLEAFETMAPRRAHLIMEFLPGGNLCSYVKAKRKIAEPELQPLMLQLATALHHMHELNIVHRDIKLENILFLDEKRTIVRVIDFGFSTRCAPDRRLRLFCGTPSYMAPEIVRRTEYRGKPIDLWSIGVVAYACLGGHFPFAARSQPELYRKILRGTYRLPEGLSPNAVALLQACIVVDVNRRVTAPDLRRHPFVVAGASNGTYPGANLGSLTRSQNPQDDVRREAVARIEALGVSRDALIQGITRGEHTPITSCYYLLMDSMGLRTGPGPHGSTSHGTLKHNNENELPQDAQAPAKPHAQKA
ncbi:protein serine/threonine kinase [Aureococcus anophagefferens]|uniref:Protein serine/threonine kinase n=2 Tax=Aureococcus anophagefferens TaxID=44056 RepID=A0ABR1FRJ7_AURAN